MWVDVIPVPEIVVVLVIGDCEPDASTTEEILQSISILWRRIDRAGHEGARLTEHAAGSVVEGTAIFAEQGQPCRLDYHVVCDAAWRTTSAKITGWLGGRAIAIDITADINRRWIVGGAECVEVQGCDDVDLSFSPATNVLPIRRLRLNIGERSGVRAAWFDFPACKLELLEQVYERIGDFTYRYESGAGAFVATLQVNAAGFVTSYPGLWQEEGAG